MFLFRDYTGLKDIVAKHTLIKVLYFILAKFKNYILLTLHFSQIL